ncbi:hypothetical protein SISSUDRAFT_1122410 [Sistotremastrum suecicum HHB10207 ss-3]|uniref:F-box domain-containing protein n=1 Tax=Sistotremastrum suecicum HHB10207 ss-3 TaxID=1314776 RepID=A0A165ZDH6_9AGAM|nr:hypothetical protein SISSUDRAFT_1122410 [Sistotremastrum suecicum HHB10207 ss-3]
MFLHSLFTKYLRKGSDDLADKTSRLPLELYRPVIEALANSPECSKTDLFHVALTCRAFRVEAQRFLYHRIAFVEGHKSSVRLVKFLRRRQHIAKLVRDLTIRNYGLFTGTRKRKTVSSYALAANFPFSLLPNLDTLTIIRNNHYSDAIGIHDRTLPSDLFTTLGTQLSSNSLTTYRCWLPMPSSHFFDFLLHQNKLEHLVLGDLSNNSPDIQTLLGSPSFLPGLLTLDATALNGQLATIMSARHIKALRLTLLPELPGDWSLYGPHLTALDLSSIAGVALQTLKELIPGVPNLRLFLFVANQQCLNEFSLLDPLLNLEALSITILVWGAPLTAFVNKVQRDCKCPKLRSFYVEGPPSSVYHRSPSAISDDAGPEIWTNLGYCCREQWLGCELDQAIRANP